MQLRSSRLSARDTHITGEGVLNVMPFRQLSMNGARRVCVLFLVALLLSSSHLGWAAKYARRTQEIPFRLFGDHLVVITGSLGEPKPRLLLIDTGTNPSVVDRETARELGLQQVGAQTNEIVVMNGTTQTYSAVLPGMAFGPIRRRGLPVNVADLSWLRQGTGIHVDAVVGLDVLDQLKFQIDYSSKKIKFGDIAMAGTRVPVSETDNFLTAEARLNGMRVNLMLDTAGSGVVLFSDGLATAASDTAPGPTVSFSNMAGQGRIHEIEVTGLTLGKANLGRALAAIADQSPSRKVQGILGISATVFKRISFDFGHGLASVELTHTVADSTDETLSCEAALSFSACYGTRTQPNPNHPSRPQCAH